MPALRECRRCGHEYYADNVSQPQRCPRCHALNGHPDSKQRVRRGLFWLLAAVAVFAYAASLAPPAWRFAPIEEEKQNATTRQAGSFDR